jgi:hypothetical protein
MEILIKAGYDRDPRVTQGFRWLLAARQRDGGWAIPLRTVGVPFAEFSTLGAETFVAPRDGHGAASLRSTPDPQPLASGDSRRRTTGVRPL